MPQGRLRNSKRTSSSSYASTITTMVFVAFCVFGLWMLNSNSVLPTSTTTHSISDPTSSSSSSSSSSVAINSPFLDKENPPPFEDDPRDIPEDVISSDDNEAGEQSTPATKEFHLQELITEEKLRAGEENETIGNEQVSNSDEKKDDTENREIVENVNSESATRETGNEESETKEAVEDQEQRSDHEENSENIEKDQNDEDGETQTEEDQRSDQLESETQENPQESENIQQLKEDQENPNPDTNVQSEDQIQAEETTQQSEGDYSFEQPGIPKESVKGWSTQAGESEDEKERRKEESDGQGSEFRYTWHLCNVTAGFDYIPCLDNEKALKKVHKTGHYEHRERHCPEEGPTCLVPLPDGYKSPIPWPTSRNKIWYKNVPHTKLAEVKGHQNWVKVTGEYLTFPGGGTQFIHGALHYIDFIQQSAPKIRWGQHTRVILDVGCGVASFGGYLFDRNVLAMSFAPKDEHEAQVQFALERGIPAFSAVMGSKRLPFPSSVFDLVHCARCRVPWHAEGGLLLLELNRVLRPGGFFVWSATPVYQKLQEDVGIWKAMSSLTASMCWELLTIKKDRLNGVGAAIYRKPSSNYCYDQRQQSQPPMCQSDDDPNAAWYVPLQACMHRVPVDKTKRGSRWPEDWPRRLQTPPYWLNSSQMGIYGRPAPQDFVSDYEHWKEVVNKTYMDGLGISLSNVRNVMDMRSVYGGFAAALKDLSVWVMNVVNVDSPDTLPIIYERGLFGIYHDWCESFSTYPRTYDLLHADHLFSKLQKRCKLGPVMAEVDRIVRPGGKLIVRDESNAIDEVENFLKSLRWEVHLTFSKDQEGLLSAQKGDWRPETYSDS